MACYNGELGPKFPSGRWEEFCKDKADSAARLFAQEFLQFVTDNPVYDASGASATFSKRFVEYFLETFDNEVHKNGLIDFGEPESPTDVFGPDDWGSSIHLTQNFKNNDKKISREEPGSRFAKTGANLKRFWCQIWSLRVSKNRHCFGLKTAWMHKAKWQSVQVQEPFCHVHGGCRCVPSIESPCLGTGFVDS